MGRTETGGNGMIYRSLLSRREFMRLGGVALAGTTLLGVAGCGGEGGQSNAKNITFATAEDTTGTVPKLIDQFNRNNENGIKVTAQKMPADGNLYLEKLRTQFQGGGGDIDVVEGSSLWLAQFAANGWVADLSNRFTKAMREQYVQSMITANTYKDKVYGVPWYTEAGLMYYRKDLLEDNGFSGPPATWDELQDMASKVMSDSRTKYGYVFQGAHYEGGVVNAREHIWTSGGDITDPQDPERVVIDSPEAVRGLAIERSHITEGVAPEVVVNYKEDESAAAFMQGDAVFLRNWPYVYSLLSDPEQSKIRTEQVGIAELPVAEEGLQSISSGGGWSFNINAASEKQDAAWEFVKFMTAPEQQKARALNGAYFPTLLGLYEDQQILEEVPVIALGKEAIKNTRVATVSPYYSDMSLVLAENFHANLKGEVTPEQTTRILQEELEDMLQRAEGG